MRDIEKIIKEIDERYKEYMYIDSYIDIDDFKFDEDIFIENDIPRKEWEQLKKDINKWRNGNK
jgi:hypothetical protein